MSENHAAPRLRASVEVIAPRVNDKRVGEETGERQRCSSRILAPWCRKSPKISEVLPLSGSINIPATGGWQTWTSVTATVTLPAGVQTLMINQDNGV